MLSEFSVQIAMRSDRSEVGLASARGPKAAARRTRTDPARARRQAAAPAAPTGAIPAGRAGSSPGVCAARRGQGGPQTWPHGETLPSLLEVIARPGAWLGGRVLA